MHAMPFVRLLCSTAFLALDCNSFQKFLSHIRPRHYFTSRNMSSFDGACACGAVTYTIQDDDLKEAAICHCKVCQAWSGGVFVYVASKHVDIKNKENLTTWNSSDWAERAFCQTCGSSLYCKITAPGPMQGEHHFGAGTLKDWKDIKLKKEIFIDRKPNGYEFVEHGGTKMTMEEIFALWGGSDDQK